MGSLFLMICQFGHIEIDSWYTAIFPKTHAEPSLFPMRTSLAPKIIEIVTIIKTFRGENVRMVNWHSSLTRYVGSSWAEKNIQETQLLSAQWSRGVHKMKIRTGMNVKVLSLGRLIFFVAPSIRTAMLCFSINPTIFNIICWVAGSIASTTKRLMVQVLFW